VTVLRRDLVCREVVELLSDYLDGGLPRRQRRRLERHLDACGACSAYLAQLEASLAAAGSLEPPPMDPATLDELTQLFRRVTGQDPEEPPLS